MLNFGGAFRNRTCGPRLSREVTQHALVVQGGGGGAIVGQPCKALGWANLQGCRSAFPKHKLYLHKLKQLIRDFVAWGLLRRPSDSELTPTGLQTWWWMHRLRHATNIGFLACIYILCLAAARIFTMQNVHVSHVTHQSRKRKRTATTRRKRTMINHHYHHHHLNHHLNHLLTSQSQTTNHQSPPPPPSSSSSSAFSASL